MNFHGMHVGIIVDDPDSYSSSLLWILKNPDKVGFALSQEERNQSISLGTLLTDREPVALTINYGIIINGGWLSC